MYSMRTRSEKSTEADADAVEVVLVEMLVRMGMIDWLRIWFSPVVTMAEPTPAAALPAAPATVDGPPCCVPASPPGPAAAGAASPNVRMDRISLCDLAGVLCSVSLR